MTGVERNKSGREANDPYRFLRKEGMRVMVRLRLSDYNQPDGHHSSYRPIISYRRISDFHSEQPDGFASE